MNVLHNVGKKDRIVRIVIAIVLLTLYFTKTVEGNWAQGALIGSFLMIMTSMRRCCPLYALIGRGTCGVDTGSTEKKIETKKFEL